MYERINSKYRSFKSAWFDEFIAGFGTHQLQLETNTATEELKNVYDASMSGNDTELAAISKMGADKHFIKGILVD